MAIKIMPTSEVREKIASVLEEIGKTDEPVFVTRRGRAEAVMISIGKYNEMLDMAEDWLDDHDEELWARIEESREAAKRGEAKPIEDVFAEIEALRRAI